MIQKNISVPLKAFWMKATSEASVFSGFLQKLLHFQRNLETRGIGGNIRMRSDAVLGEISA